MPEIFFTADQHFGHSRIIQHCNRPFADIYEMEKILIKNWNELVEPKDHVYVLGDFCWTPGLYSLSQLIKKLNGHLYLIKGNHDKRCVNQVDFGWVDNLRTIKINKTKIILCHYAMRSWDSSSHGSYHLHGHSHGKLDSYKNSIDVGVDSWDFKPVNWKTLLKEFQKLSLKEKIHD